MVVITFKKMLVLAQAAVTDYHSLNNIYLSFGDWKVQDRVLANLVPSEGPLSGLHTTVFSLFPRLIGEENTSSPNENINPILEVPPLDLI